MNTTMTALAIIYSITCIAGLIATSHYNEKARNYGNYKERHINELKSNIGVAVTLLSLVLAITTFGIMSFSESKEVTTEIDDYIQTLEPKQNHDIILIEDIHYNPVSHESTADVAYTEDDSVIEKNMPIKANLDDNAEPYITYKELDKNPEVLLGEKEIVATRNLPQKGSKHEYTLHVPKKLKNKYDTK